MTRMSPEAIEARKKYMREYMKTWRSRPENKKKQQEYNSRYWEKKVHSHE